MFSILYVGSSGTFSVGLNYSYYDRDKDYYLFVTPKYDNLKEEILHYKHIDIDQYKQEIYPKAEAYWQTQWAQSLIPLWDTSPDEYGILEDEIISKERLITIILYTDYTDLSSHFTSSFRKSNTFEPYQATKQRHRNYYWMSKLLRETVRCYGQNHDDNTDEYTGIFGPFYCGMSAVMTMPQFSIQLFSPTSTSCQIAVATRFSGESGIIIEFDNDGGHASFIHGLNVSWISRFREEDERYEDFYKHYLYFSCS